MHARSRTAGPVTRTKPSEPPPPCGLLASFTPFTSPLSHSVRHRPDGPWAPPPGPPAGAWPPAAGATA
ncbi:hypothetical protein ADK43_27845 [Streptomyces rimosus subsp. rimosus]|nr:hypothetical protein ADK43_27845 [Streptomyces rimosus subsp. rimosus]